MDNIVWESDQKVSKNSILVLDDFEKNRLAAMQSCEVHAKKVLRNFKMKAHTHHVEIGITYPRSHSKTNNYHAIAYNQDSFEFKRRCKNAYEFFHKEYLRF